MTIKAYAISITLCTIILLCVPVDDAGALTYLAQTKHVGIDTDWQITGQYTYEFEISDPDDVRIINQILRQYTAQTNLFSELLITVQLPNGQKTTWEHLNQDLILPKTSVFIAYTISKTFPGFEELFADYMHIDQIIPVKKADYRITFPEKTAFIYQISQGKESHQSESFTDFFSWSGNNIRHLDIKVSTATSWEQITQRYLTHFQHRMKNGFIKTRLPESFKNIDTNSLPNEKIDAVMDFFKNNFDYRRHSQSGHDLLPDDPDTVLHRGWGDCKDIALLETVLLQSMGIDAFVVLTGKPGNHCKERCIPDPFIFDHALVGIYENGSPAYYDCLAPGFAVSANEQNVYLHLKVFNDAQ